MKLSPVAQLANEFAKVTMNMTPQQRLAFYLSAHEATQGWLENHYRHRRQSFNPLAPVDADSVQVNLRG